MKIFQSLIFFKNYRRAPLKSIVNLLKENQGQSRLNIFGKDLFITSRAEDVNYTLKENAANYLKGRTTQKLQVLLGQGLITAEGETWRKQHKLIRPLMNTKGIIHILPKMAEVIDFYFKDFSVQKTTNISKEMTTLTWKIVLNALFSVGPHSIKNEEWLDGILDVMEAVTARTRSLLPIPFWVPTPKNLKMKKTIKQFDHFVYDLIENRKNLSSPPSDLLSLLQKAKEETSSGHEQMNNKQIRDEMITFLMAGHETVANSMTWLMILLAQNPEYFQKLRNELDSVQNIENFEEKVLLMPLHRATIDEAQRLYPPVWIFMREAIKADSINSQKIKSGTNVVVVPFVSHRDPQYWTAPEKFMPERFINNPKIKAGAYYPFGLGPRACIGFNFATYESVMILSFMVKNFNWEIQNPTVQTMNAGLTLRPTSNINIKMTKI